MARRKFSDWAEYYGGELSWSKFFNSLKTYDHFLEAIIGASPKTALEVGCGPGTKSIFLSYLGVECTAIDNNEEILDLARRNNENLHGNVRFRHGDAFALEFGDRSFDVAHHSGFLEHFSDEQILCLLDEQLRVALSVVFVVPNEYYPSQDFGNERLLSRAHWEKILADYRIEISEYFGPGFSRNILELSYEAFVLKAFRKDLRKPMLYLAKVMRR